jgi:hypothetical protein
LSLSAIASQPRSSGKSHLAQGIGHRACIVGHDVVFTSAHEMLLQLRASRADASYDRRMLSNPDFTGVIGGDKITRSATIRRSR